MKSALVCVAVLALAGGVLGNGCYNTPEYTSNLKLACVGDELKFNWPYYYDVSQYLVCLGRGRPHLLKCPAENYFSYVYQTCRDCNEYIPSQTCETLEFTKGSSYCETMNATEPTPIYPTTVYSTSTTKTPEDTTRTTPTLKPITPKPTPTPKPTTQDPGHTDFPPAPSPSTVDPSVPTPPTAPPTPPPVESKPPTVPIAKS